MAFGYTTATADAAKDHLDHHLKLVEHHLEQIAKAVPQAGATVSRLDEAKEIAVMVVGELQDEIDRRTDEGGSGAGGQPPRDGNLPAAPTPSGAASTPTGGPGSGVFPIAGSGHPACALFGHDYWDEPGAGGCVMSTELVVTAQVDVDSERKVFAYGAKVPREMFALVVFRCPACGSTGTAGSWCEGHSAPPDCFGCSLRVERQPVLVPHADGPSRTEIVEDRADKLLADRIASEIREVSS